MDAIFISTYQPTKQGITSDPGDMSRVHTADHEKKPCILVVRFKLLTQYSFSFFIPTFRRTATKKQKPVKTAPPPSTYQPATESE